MSKPRSLKNKLLRNQPKIWGGAPRVHQKNNRNVNKRHHDDSNNHANIKRLRYAIGQPKFTTDPSGHVNLSITKYSVYQIISQLLPNTRKIQHKDIDAFTRRIKRNKFFTSKATQHGHHTTHITQSRLCCLVHPRLRHKLTS